MLKPGDSYWYWILFYVNFPSIKFDYISLIFLIQLASPPSPARPVSTLKRILKRQFYVCLQKSLRTTTCIEYLIACMHMDNFHHLHVHILKCLQEQA